MGEGGTAASQSAAAHLHLITEAPAARCTLPGRGMPRKVTDLLPLSSEAYIIYFVLPIRQSIKYHKTFFYPNG